MLNSNYSLRICGMHKKYDSVSCYKTALDLFFLTYSETQIAVMLLFFVIKIISLKIRSSILMDCLSMAKGAYRIDNVF
jgi:hypothetical protein